MIVSTSAESSFYNETLKLILEKNNFSKCIIFCSVHTSVLNYNTIFPRGNKIDYDKSQQDKWTDGKYETEVSKNYIKQFLINNTAVKANMKIFFRLEKQV